MKKRVYFDANVLIAHQLTNHQYFTQAKQLLETLWKQGSVFYLSSLTIDELFYGIGFCLRAKDKNKPYAKIAAQLKEIFAAIISWQNVELISFDNNLTEIIQVLSYIKKYNLRPRDAFHLQIMKQNQLKKIATFDNDFKQVEKLTDLSILS